MVGTSDQLTASIPGSIDNRATILDLPLLSWLITC